MSASIRITVDLAARWVGLGNDETVMVWEAERLAQLRTPPPAIKIERKIKGQWTQVSR